MVGAFQMCEDKQKKKKQEHHNGAVALTNVSTVSGRLSLANNGWKPDTKHRQVFPYNWWVKQTNSTIKWYKCTQIFQPVNSSLPGFISLKKSALSLLFVSSIILWGLHFIISYSRPLDILALVQYLSFTIVIGLYNFYNNNKQSELDLDRWLNLPLSPQSHVISSGWMFHWEWD